MTYLLFVLKMIEVQQSYLANLRLSLYINTPLQTIAVIYLFCQSAIISLYIREVGSQAYEDLCRCLKHKMFLCFIIFCVAFIFS